MSRPNSESTIHFSAESTQLLGRRGSAVERHSLNSSFALRAVAVGMLVGILINLSNTHYGLVVGGGAQMPTVSVLFGHLAFVLPSKLGFVPLTKAETVLLISTATATGCMTITAGFAEFIPGIEYILEPKDGGPMHLGWLDMFHWAFGLCFFGIVFAALLRTSLVTEPGLPWPGAKATSNIIQALHTSRAEFPIDDPEEPVIADEFDGSDHIISHAQAESLKKLRIIVKSSVWAGLFTVLMYFFPIARAIPIFGRHMAKEWLWAINLSPGLFGSGLIVGPEICLHTLAGAVVSWGILSPYVKSQGWASGAVGDWRNGSRAWLVWISLSALTADAAVKIAFLCIHLPWKSNNWADVARKWTNNQYSTPHSNRRDDHGYSRVEDELDSSNVSRDFSHGIQANQSHEPVSWKVLGVGFLVSIIVCVFTTKAVFGPWIPWYYVLLAIVFALPMGVVGIRSLGELDYNPQSGLISQLIFASITPHSNRNAVIMNVVSAAISTAGASQTGDLAYDFKIGELVGASPNPQMYGQIIGSIFGCFVSCATYRLYTTSFSIPGPFLQIPTSFIQIRTAEILMGRGLLEGVVPFALGCWVFFAVASLIKIRYKDYWWQAFVPSGVSFALGTFIAPAFTLPRVAGGLCAWFLASVLSKPKSFAEVLGSGLVVGESIGTLSYVALQALHAPQWGPS